MVSTHRTVVELRETMRTWIKKLFGPYSKETKKVQMTFFFGSWAALAFVGLLIPETALTDNPGLRTFTDFMASFIPQIDRVTALNLNPEINRLHYSILWAVSPVYFAIMLSSIFKEAIAETARRTYGQAIGALVGMVWFVGFTMFLWDGLGFVDDPTNRIARAMFYFGLSRAMFAPVAVFVFWGAVVLILVTIWRLVTGRFHRAERSEAHGGQ